MYSMKEPNDFLALVKNESMMFNPGENFHYNNGGFVILALVVEKITGENLLIMFKITF